MKHLFFAASLAGVVTALPVTAFAQTTPAEEAVVQAMLGVDCLMTRANEEAVLAATGLSEDDAGAAAGALFERGMFEETEAGVYMLHSDCPSRSPSGVEAAIAWMGAMSFDQSADVVAELLAARGCAYGSDDFARFQGEVAAAVGRRFEFNETVLLSEEMDPFLDALETMMTSGVLQLVRQERVEDGANGVTLRDCDAE